MVLLWASAIVAGGAGACVRYLVSVQLAVPGWAVLLVNVSGSALVGAVLGLTGLGDAAHAATDAATHTADSAVTAVLLGGFAGGLTTFSTFSVETVALVEDRLPWRAAGFAAANLVLGFAAAALAYTVASSIVS